MATLKNVNLEIYIYSGTSGSYSSTDLKYTLQKEIIAGQTSIVFEVAELVRDYITVSFNNDYVCNTVWVTTVATLQDENDQPFTYGSPLSNTYLAFDGYGFYEDGTNPQGNLYDLITASTIYLPKDTTGKLPINAENTGSVVIDSATTSITDSGNSNQKIQYITIPANSSTIQVKDAGGTTKKTITVINQSEPKYTPIKATFINRHGSLENFYFFKKSSESFSVQDSSYQRNIMSASSATYNIYNGQKQRYNVNASSEVKLNTGFINEDSTQTIEELLLSDNIWIYYNSKTLAVLPKSKSMEIKTSLNDRLINYTINFEFAFNKINNIR